MAEIEKKAAAAQEKKAEKKPAKDKKPSIFSRIAKFFREYKAELKKVTWASRQDTFRNTVVVGVTVIVVGVVVYLLDLGFSEGINALSNLIA